MEKNHLSMDENKNSKCIPECMKIQSRMLDDRKHSLFLADVFVLIYKFNHQHYFAFLKLTRASFQSWQNLTNCKLCLIARSIFIIFRKLLCSSSAVNAFAAGRHCTAAKLHKLQVGEKCNDFREVFSVLSQRICCNEWGLKLCRYEPKDLDFVLKYKIYHCCNLGTICTC